MSIKKIVIDIGHLNNTYEKTGGKGCKLNGKVIEEFNLNVLIATNLYSILKSQGIQCYYSTEYKTKNEPDNLADRYNYINKINPDLSVSIHHDYSSNKNTRGFTIYTWRGNTDTLKLKKQITTEMKKTSKECVLNNNGYSVCYPGHQNFALVRGPKCDAMLIECGFFSNQEDVKLTENNSWSIAYRIACGILNKTIPIKTNYKYYVQVGAFNQIKNAKELVEKLKKKGFDAIIKEK